MRKRLSLLYIIVFLAMLCASGVSLLTGYEAKNVENRPLARFPQIGSVSVAEFPSAFDRWFEDHFGLREEMVTAFNGFTMALFRDTLNDKVIVGDDMLFYMDTLEDYTGASALSDGDIERVANSLRLQSEYAESIGAKFIFAIAPNKNTVYPELMPGMYSGTGQKSNRERLYSALDAQGINTLDLAGLLIAKKSDGLLYHAEDTHWNDRGALIAYDAIMNAIGARGESYAKLTPITKNDYAGDLHNFVLPAQKGMNARPEYDIKTDFEYDKGARPAQDAVFGTTSGKNETRLYMMRDSFAIALIPYISANIGRAVYSSEFPYNYANVPPETPDAIIVELAERNIKNLLISAPVMPAVEKRLPPSAVNVSASIQTRERSGYTQIYGCFEGAPFSTGAKIYVRAGEKIYEAFPILEEGVDTSGYTLPRGFCVTVGAEGVGDVVGVWVG